MWRTQRADENCVVDEYSSGSGGFSGSSHGSSGGRRESFGDKMIDKAAEFAKKKW